MKTPHVDILSEKYSEKSESIRRRRDMLCVRAFGVGCKIVSAQSQCSAFHIA